MRWYGALRVGAILGCASPELEQDEMTGAVTEAINLCEEKERNKMNIKSRERRTNGDQSLSSIVQKC